ncbi:hypothetical protein BJ508DRAFT_313494 [Ascobolus immersus RN42]|uniref:Aminoglycoside phosphotransferase domain-containing protein n=1 Tax=Ascobolus immersus RN42 TaxID=1160509 RepID=A0A3N4HKI9_ASCIM|nr:hypothetical protein BJ508DRAFT_313494 [Ascobolus immersus RN42]
MSTTSSLRICVRNWYCIRSPPLEHGCANVIPQYGTSVKDPAFIAGYNHFERERMGTLLRQININALLAAATRARGLYGLEQDLPCYLPAFMPGRDTVQEAFRQRGTHHFCLDIVFGHMRHSDVPNRVWVAKFPLSNSYNASPAEFEADVFHSEVATLKFLAETEVQAPTLYEAKHQSDSTNTVGPSYMLLQKLRGTTVKDLVLKNHPGFTMESMKLRLAPSLLKYFKQIAASKPFNNCGSITSFLDGEAFVGGYVLDSLFDFSGQLQAAPFETAEEAYSTIINHQLSTLRNPAVVRKSYATKNILKLSYIQQKVGNVIQYLGDDNNKNNFYITHKGLGPEKILIDEQTLLLDGVCNITGICGWHGAFVQPTKLAFATPYVLQPAYETTPLERHLQFSHGELALLHLMDRDRFCVLLNLNAYARDSRFWQSWWDALVVLQNDEVSVRKLFSALEPALGDYPEYYAFILDQHALWLQVHNPWV